MCSMSNLFRLLDEVPEGHRKKARLAMGEMEGVMKERMKEKEGMMKEKEGVMKERMKEKEGMMKEKEGVMKEKEGVMKQKEGVTNELVVELKEKYNRLAQELAEVKAVYGTRPLLELALTRFMKMNPDSPTHSWTAVSEYFLDMDFRFNNQSATAVGTEKGRQAQQALSLVHQCVRGTHTASFQRNTTACRELALAS